MLEGQPEEKHLFKSNVHVATYFCALLLILACVFITSLGLMDESNSADKKSVTVLFAAFSLFMTIIFMNSLLQTSNVVVDKKGIKRVFFTKVWKQLEWNKIKSIRIFQVRDYDNPFVPKKVNVYRLETEERGLHSVHINLSEKYIPNMKALLEIISHRAAEHGIGIIDCRQTPTGHSAKL